MATIDSVELYLSQIYDPPGVQQSGWDIRVNIRSVGNYTSDPTTGSLLGSKSILVDNVPPLSLADWVVFTFDSPIEISDNGFYAIHVSCDASNYDAVYIKWYGASDWSDATGGEPYTGKERAWNCDTSGVWSAGNTRAYRLNCTGCNDNLAETPTGTSYNFSGLLTRGQGIRSYLIAGAVPLKPINPTPANAVTNVTLDQPAITWEDGGGATSYNVYYGKNEAGLTLVSLGQEGLSFTISGIVYGSPFGYITSRTWRIDAVNDAGTTTGDVWTFTTITLDPPLPTGLSLDSGGGNKGTGVTGTASGENNIMTIRRLVAAAKNKVWYEI